MATTLPLLYRNPWGRSRKPGGVEGKQNKLPPQKLEGSTCSLFQVSQSSSLKPKFKLSNKKRIRESSEFISVAVALANWQLFRVVTPQIMAWQGWQCVPIRLFLEAGDWAKVLATLPPLVLTCFLSLVVQPSHQSCLRANIFPRISFLHS